MSNYKAEVLERMVEVLQETKSSLGLDKYERAIQGKAEEVGEGTCEKDGQDAGTRAEAE